MLVTEQGNIRVQMGSSYMDVENWLTHTRPVWRDDLSREPGDYYGKTWSLGADFKEAKRLGREGWQEGADKVHAGLSLIAPPSNRHYKLRRDVAGHYPDVARYLSGAPDHMIRRGHEHATRPVLNIVLSSFLSAAVPASCLVNYGVAMCGAIERLEANGRRVELSVCFHSKMYHDRTEAMSGWTVKMASEPLDITALAFALAHPAACRRIGFAMYERLPLSADGSMYGSPLNSMTEKHLALIGQEGGFMIDVSGMKLLAASTPALAMKFTQDAINRALGEEILEEGDE